MIKIICCLILSFLLMFCTIGCKQNSNNISSSQEALISQSIDFEKMYGLKSLESVEYKCYKNVPNGDAQYEITAVLNDKGENLLSACDFTCANKNIEVDNFIINIPYKYKSKNKSVALTATHRLSGIKLDFKIEFNENYKLILEEEFEGDTINTDVWSDIWDTDLTLEKRDDYSFGFKKEWAFLDGDGHLVCRVEALDQKDSAGNPIFASSCVSAKGGFESKYGYYEMSFIPHRTTGMWGAFWILAGDMGDPHAADDNTSQNGIEIDIFESLLNRNTMRHALFWDGYYNNQTKGCHSYAPEMPELFDGKFHKVALQWTPTEFIFLVDDNVTYRTEAAGGCGVPGYMLISSHVNAKDAGELLLKPGEYSDMIVDYIRVYSSFNNE